MPLLHSRSHPAYLLTAVGGALLVVCAYRPAWWAGMVAGAVMMMAGSLLIWRYGEVSLATVLVVAVAGRILLLPMPPLLSDDAYRYIWDGLLQLEGINPYLFRPSDPALDGFRDLWVYPLLNSPTYYSVYPPVSQMIYAGAGLLYIPDTLSSYYAIKLVVVGCELGAVYLLSRELSPRNVLLYAWHPLVWLEFAGQAHQEGVMIGCLVLSWWLLRTGRPRFAVAALTLAGWVKLYPLLLLPFLLRRTGGRHVWVAGAVSVGVWIPYAHPAVFDHLLESLQLYVQLFEFNAGPYYAAKGFMQLLTGADWSKILGPLFAGTFLVGWLGIYAVDRHVSWQWPAVVVLVFGMYLVLATTVHPWYLTGLLAFIPLLHEKSFHWIWLSTWAIGTYLFYRGGPYWLFVWIGWGGWLVLLLVRHRRTVLDFLLRRRAEVKWRRIRPHIPADARSLLDLGAGEGYVGAVAAEQWSGDVRLADVQRSNRTALPFTEYERHLPFAGDTFDVTMLVYVLHHALEPPRVLDEARRVTCRRIVVLESVYQNRLDRWVLHGLDWLVNTVRFFGERSTIPHVKLRTADEWRYVLENYGDVIHESRFGRFPHRQVLFVVQMEDGTAE